ncbi:MAG: SocA family protein [Methanobrevibacter sp.]|jgi:hypothetical protein|nr:SocA family protein [Candidatus Methanoflexus mossambicus]
MKELIDYIINKWGNEGNLWRTTLYEILYFSDFNFYELNENAITNENYNKYPRCPVPVRFVNLKKELVNEKKIEKIEKYPFMGAIHKGFNYKSLKSPDIKLLSSNELKIVDDVGNKLINMNTDEISKYSHGDLPWMVAEEFEIMDYCYVFYMLKDYSLRS